ncbi:MAG TPA: YceI family protein [Mycobacteriales bacterium]|jgi:polyisoprenoid-binding protein YceI
MTTTTGTELRDGTWTVSADSRATFSARNFGIRTVTGTLAMDRGTVTVTGGRPVAAEGALRADSVETGIAQRDGHLRGPNFFHAERHPHIGLRALRFEPADEGWVVPAMLTVGGAETPVTLHARRLPDPAPGAIAVLITGAFDRTSTRIRAPRFMVGHRIAMAAELRFTRS